MKLKIYGSGCKKCQQLTDNAKQAANALGLTVEIEKITDVNAIIDEGIMRTPALGIDDEVVIEGKVASVEEIQKLLSA
ncbi:thioredoxin family protein [Halomonas sp. GFAJ-1]|uniref:thioredoxin family protein n=1 Tax=Halomonas sp. GFAJ-1 TaxID=1118153 RepID=UPI00023A5098|nr:thioredoxin family protein [Halomonas sp. GFAJ-1]AVI63885.1 redox-active disulfide protein 2 [Halomonas sp. GFAJ-1]EHK59629.1 redox-active disulfide protein [Halomonas sp. GFAJ-1]